MSSYTVIIRFGIHIHHGRVPKSVFIINKISNKMKLAPNRTQNPMEKELSNELLLYSALLLGTFLLIFLELTYPHIIKSWVFSKSYPGDSSYRRGNTGLGLLSRKQNLFIPYTHVLVCSMWWIKNWNSTHYLKCSCMRNVLYKCSSDVARSARWLPLYKDHAMCKWTQV